MSNITITNISPAVQHWRRLHQLPSSVDRRVVCDSMGSSQRDRCLNRRFSGYSKSGSGPYTRMERKIPFHPLQTFKANFFSFLQQFKKEYSHNNVLVNLLIFHFSFFLFWKKWQEKTFALFSPECVPRLRLSTNKGPCTYDICYFSNNFWPLIPCLWIWTNLWY